MSLQTDYSKIKTKKDLYDFLNKTAQEKNLQIIDTSEISHAKTKEELAQAINKITLKLIERNKGFYAVEKLNFTLSLGSQPVELFLGEKIKMIMNTFQSACDNLPDPKDDFFPNLSKMPVHIFKLIAEIITSHANAPSNTNLK